MVRKPIAAGTFYPKVKKELLEELEFSFTSKFGHGDVGSYGTASAAIVPHAGLAYSGPCASHAYSSIKKDSKLFIIIGANHTSIGEPIAISDEEWQTPLGIVQSDKTIIDSLIKSGFKIDNNSHRFEHSIEVQIPFLQYKFKDFKIVAITISHKASVSDVKKLAEELSKIDATFIASSDFTHYGYNYDFVPFEGTRKEVRAEMYKLDRQLIGAIDNLNSEKFLKESDKTTVCGSNSIATVIEIAKYKDLAPNLLQYYTSGDLIGDYNNAVGYAAIIFE